MDCFLLGLPSFVRLRTCATVVDGRIGPSLGPLDPGIRTRRTIQRCIVDISGAHCSGCSPVVFWAMVRGAVELGRRSETNLLRVRSGSFSHQREGWSRRHCAVKEMLDRPAGRAAPPCALETGKTHTHEGAGHTRVFAPAQLSGDSKKTPHSRGVILRSGTEPAVG